MKSFYTVTDKKNEIEKLNKSYVACKICLTETSGIISNRSSFSMSKSRGINERKVRIPRITFYSCFYSCLEWLRLVPSTSILADSAMELGRGSLELPKGPEHDT